VPTRGAIQQLSIAASTAHEFSNVFVVVQVVTETGAGLGNVRVATSEGTPVVYAGNNGQPDPTRTTTGAIGLAYAFNTNRGVSGVTAHIEDVPVGSRSFGDTMAKTPPGTIFVKLVVAP
jgi:hypothetical protein